MTYECPPTIGACRSGKIQYASRKQAKREARRRHPAERLHAYWCNCGWFHIGHQPDEVRNGAVDKAAWLDGSAWR